MSALSLAAPQIIIAPVHAQALPTGCTDAATTGTPNDNDGAFDAGETITCVSPPDPISSIDTTVEDLTIIIGDGSTATNVNTGTSPTDNYGVRLSNGGNVQILGDDSEVNGENVGVQISNTVSDVDDLTVTSEGTISATASGAIGVDIDNLGSGSASVNVRDVAANTSSGSAISVDHDGADLDIVSNGTLTGRRGVFVSSAGAGPTTVSVDTIDASYTGIDIFSSSSSAGDVVVTASGAITATDRDGVAVSNNGSGSTTISVTSIEAGAYGFNIGTDSSSGDLSVTASGTIVADDAGAALRHDGSGSVYLSLADVDSAASNYAVFVRNYGTDIDVRSSGLIESDSSGVVALNNGTGVANISVNDVTANDGAGIDVETAPSAGLVSITASGAIAAYGTGSGESGVGVYANIQGAGVSIDAASVYGERYGVYIDDRSNGPVTVSATDVTGGERDGVFISGNATSGVSLTTTGVVSGGENGVFIRGYGETATININGATGATGAGVSVFMDMPAVGDIDITSTGDISGGTDGIVVQHINTGDISIAAANVSGVSRGIYAFGAGDFDITTTGLVSATNNDGIDVFNTASGNEGVTINAAAITAGAKGVDVRHYGSSAVSITTTGAVDAASIGIDVYATDSDVVIDAGGDVAAQTGAAVEVIANNGAIDVTTTGDVTSVDSNGLFLVGAGNGVTLIATGSVVGGGYGIFIRNNGAGAAAVDVADVTGGAGGVGVDVQVTGGTDLSVTASGAVSAGAFGVRAVNTGTGAVTLDLADVTSDGDIGIFAVSDGTDLTITASGTVQGAGDGVTAFSNGSGTASIAVVDVVSTGAGANGIAAFAANDLNIVSTGHIDGASTGIGAFATGSGIGDMSISVVDVTGRMSDGMFIAGAGGAISIASQGTVQGADRGIQIFQNGIGDVSVNANNVYALVGGGDAVYILNGATGGELSITSTGVITSAEDDGIDLLNYGAALTINASGTVTGASQGIDATHYGSGDVRVSANNVYALAGGDDAIQIYNSAAGAVLSITTMGVVASAEDDGIEAANFGETLEIAVAGGSVTGDQSGIEAYNFGNGAATITLAGTVAGETENGVFAINYGGALTVSSTGTVSGGYQGVTAVNLGSGAVSVSVNNAYALAGGDDAIEVYNSSSGVDLFITTTGNVTSTDDDGIEANNYGAGVVITTSGGAVTGEQSGIESYNFGSGATTITVSNAVTGETEIGVFSVSGAGSNVTINDGGAVTGEIAALWLDGGTMPGDPADDVLTLNTGGSISGDALLFAGDDIFNDASGQFTNVFGGEGTDTVNFLSGGGRSINGSGADGDALQEFEVFNFNAGGFTLTGDHVGLTSTAFNAGTNTLMGALTSTQTIIADGATLNAADGSVITGLLDVNGTLNIGNSPGVSTVDGDVVFGSTAALPIEIEGDDNDLLVATGSVALDGELEVILLSGLGGASTTRTIIDAGTDITGDFAGVTGANGLLITNTVDIDELNFDVTLTTTLVPASSVDGLNENQTNIGDTLVDLLSNDDLDPTLTDYIASIGAISDASELGSVLSELSPEGFDAGLRFLAQSQGRFVSGIASRAAQSSEDGPYIWGAIDLSHLSKNDDAHNQGFRGDIHEFSAGVSNLGQGPVRFGIAGGYATFNGETDAGLSDETDAMLYRLAVSAHLPLAVSGLNGGIENVLSFAAGESDLSMQVVDPSASAPIQQSGEADIRSFGFTSRFTATGLNDRDWPINPHAQVGVDRIKQDAAFIGLDQPTALSVEDVASTRAHIGLGASFDRQLMERLTLRASATGLRYFGDTQNVFKAHFVNAPDGAPAFETVGTHVQWQARMQAGAIYEHKSGFALSADAFGEAGDINAYGVRLELSREF